ncbi:MAG: carboxylating nicotinate-nucleotide diphosphorylase [Candidatus Odinarchaeota archaeon]
MTSSPPFIQGGLPHQLILQKFYTMLDEDIGFGDITTSALIPSTQLARGRLFAREPGVIAGIEIANIIFTDFGCSTKTHHSDGKYVKNDSTLLEVTGPAATILTIERTLLNLLQRMSGIATATAKMVKQARTHNPKIRIAATRKTAPLLRFFDKLAVIIGGGDPHRWRLDDAILIKDNHLAFVSDVKKAIQSAKQYASFTCPIEIEVGTPTAALIAAKAGADVLLLDNMSPTEVSSTIEQLNQLQLPSKPLLEVSGDITPKNISDYAQTGVNVISMGWLTHSVTALNLSLDLKPTKHKK